MAKWQLRYYGDPCLRTKCEPIEEITDEIKELAQFLLHYADNNNGIGLAAPQVGETVRLIVLRDYVVLPDGKWSVTAPKFFINPKILSIGDETDVDTEGCLSFGHMNVGPIERPTKVKVEATNLEGETFIDERQGLNARVFFHENDHLNGVLHIDRLPPRVRKKINGELNQIKKKYRSK